MNHGTSHLPAALLPNTQHYDPPLTCPNSTGLIGSCVESCSQNTSCSDGQLCCSNGCGHTCVNGVTVTPSCRAVRTQIASSDVIGVYVPQCDENGNYLSVQCHGSTGYCWCVNTDNGWPTSAGARGQPNCGSESIVDEPHSQTTHTVWE